MSKQPKTDLKFLPMPKDLEELDLVPLPRTEYCFRMAWLILNGDILKSSWRHKVNEAWPLEFENMIRDGNISAKQARRDMLVDAFKNFTSLLVVWTAFLALTSQVGAPIFTNLYQTFFGV